MSEGGSKCEKRDVECAWVSLEFEQFLGPAFILTNRLLRFRIGLGGFFRGLILRFFGTS